MKTFKEFVAENEDTESKEVEPTEEEEVMYPKGVYMCVDMVEESTIALKSYMEKYIPDLEHNEEQHCTLVYSKKEQKEEIETKEYQAIGTFVKFSKFGPEGNVLVAEIECDMLVDRNDELVEEYEFISDYDEYKPHFTLSYNAEKVDVNSLPPLDFAIYFDNETASELDENWAEDDDKDDKDSKEDKDSSDEEGTITGRALDKLRTKEQKDKVEAEKQAKKEKEE